MEALGRIGLPAPFACLEEANAPALIMSFLLFNSYALVAFPHSYLNFLYFY